ncbi:glycosyltransferase [Methylobacterium sp.]|uniref:glycosyltransferase family 2 protein n=1 Tax=Methylobacterium sp. TaxID=409 RepID=UPI0025858594|nr:glycosyltransferase [Methylobacterium sp.]
MDRLAVIIATRGRPALVRAIVDWLGAQTRPAERIIVVGTQPADIAALPEDRPGLTVRIGPAGLPRQRNDGLRLAGDAYDGIVFFDDDFVPSRFWLEKAADTFRAHPDLAALTGTLIADGIKSPGIALDDALARVAAHDAAPPRPGAGLDGRFGPYGCNMAFRTAAIRGLSFDERLPLYAWLEDSDFGGQILRRGGRTARAEALRGIHLGHKAGREQGLRLGYSQIANPLYLAGKGTLPLPVAANLMLRNVTANMVRALASEPYVDRPGRLKGNVVALGDILRGRLAPERVTQL